MPVAIPIALAASAVTAGAASIVSSSMTNSANKDIADATNEANAKAVAEQNATNKEIAQMNIDYQKEFNQQVFEREDTAYERMARDASSVGLNPLAIAQPSASGGVASAPQSSQVANAPHYQGYNAIGWSDGVTRGIGAGASLASALNQFQTGLAERDLLREQAQKMENENKFFDTHGYYPSDMTGFDKVVTTLSNIIDGKNPAVNNILDKIDEKAGTALSATVGSSGSDFDKQFKKQSSLTDRTNARLDKLVDEVVSETDNFIVKGIKQLRNSEKRSQRVRLGQNEYERTLDRGYVIGY